MVKKMLFCALLVLCAQSAPVSMSHDPMYLPEVTLVGLSFEDEIYEVLIQGRDSVILHNGKEVVIRDVAGVDTIFARLIVAQARLESGNFNSPLCVRHNNFYGMLHPGRGKLTTSLGPWARAEGRNGYASYESVEASVLDLMLLLEYDGIVSARSPADYARQLKAHHYFTSSTALYASNLKYHLCK